MEHNIFSFQCLGQEKTSFVSNIMIGPFAGSNRRQVKSVVIGRPILLALEDIDGSPSFLEKALTFIETYGMTSLR